jgi:uncharacterized protein (DUF58 family)
MMHGVSASIAELIALRQQAEFSLISKTPPSKQMGQYTSPLRGRGMEFSEVRNYQAGDEIRHMEWRVTARTGRPHVKLFHEERERPIFLIVDFNPSMFFGSRVAFKSVVASRLGALLAWRALSQGDKVGGLLFNSHAQHEFVPNAREVNLMKLIGQLAEYTQFQNSHLMHKPRPLSETLLKIRRVSKPGSLIIIISDFYAFDQLSDPHLTQLRQHHDILAFHLCDPLELSSPAAGLYPLTNRTQHLLLNTYDENIRQSYLDAWSKRHTELKQRCQRLGLHYNQVQTTTSLPTFLHHVFPGRRHGR